MIMIVLMQRASTSGGLGTAFGGGITESAFGTETGNILTKGTVYAAIAFFIISFGLFLGYMSMMGDEPDNKLLLPDIRQTNSMPSSSSTDIDTVESFSIPQITFDASDEFKEATSDNP